jgi:modulator of FtsH protease HflC
VSTSWVLRLVAVVAVLLTVNSAGYTVSQVEQAIITQFGEPVGEPITEPGLHWKLPFVQKVYRFDKRWLEWDGSADEMPTREKTYIYVDSYARWRIVDPLKFFTSVQHETGAQSRLDDIIDSETRNVIAAHNLIEVVRSTSRPFEKSEEAALLDDTGGGTPRTLDVRVGRDKLTRIVLEQAARAMPDFGIELVDVQFQRVNYTESVQNKVFERMVSERRRIAERYRSEGQGSRAEIVGKKERELRTIQSEAYRKEQEIKGKADAEAARIAAESFGADAGLYRLLKSLESYKRTINSDTTLVLSTDADYLKGLVSAGR